MRRKALLMGMAVLAGLPAGASAKVLGKMDRGFQSYDAKYGAMAVRWTSGGREAADPSPAAGTAPNRLKGLLGTEIEMGGWVAGLAAETRGWQVEMLQPRLEKRLSEIGDPRVKPTEPLGVRFRYTF